MELYQVNIDSADTLIDFLETKGQNHNYYYHYTTWDSLEKIITNKTFLLTRGNSLSINDQHEALMKGNWSTWNKTYIGSFAFGAPENMAMWGLYGLPWEDAVRIRIPRKEMLGWKKSIKSVYAWDGKKEMGEIMNPKVTLTDIVYINGKKHDNDFVLSHNGRHVTIHNSGALKNLDTLPKMTGYIKNYAWHYEDEVRLKIELPHNITYDRIMLKLPQNLIDSISVTLGPYFHWKDNELIEELYANGKVADSGFTNLVKYRALCSMCRHRAFERNE